MGLYEIQPIQYLYMFNNILSWTTTILITIFVRKNFQVIGSAKYGINHNLVLLNLIPFLNIVTLPLMLKIFENNTSKEREKIEFGFKYSIANLLLLTVGSLMAYMPAFLLQQSMQEIVGNNSNITIQNLNLVGALLSNPIYGLILCFITIAYSVMCVLIYKEQKNSIKTTPQLEEIKNVHESLNHEIIFAVKNKDSNLVSQLLKNGKSANSEDENGVTLMSIAINNNDTIMIQLLRAYGAKD